LTFNASFDRWYNTFAFQLAQQRAEVSDTLTGPGLVSDFDI